MVFSAFQILIVEEKSMSLPIGSKRGKYKPKSLKFTSVCKYCNTTFASADVKTKICKQCKIPKVCVCGCGRLVKTPGFTHASGCKSRGKSYLEIYGTLNPSNGFKKGELNPMANAAYRQKVSEGVKNSYTPELREVRKQAKLNQLDNGLVYGKILYTNTRGESFRSILEYDFAEFLFSKGIAYQYEAECIPLVDNYFGYKRKVPDFIVNNNIIEITGLAYPKWIEEFKQRIQVLKQSTKRNIILITYPDKVELLQDLVDERTYVLNYFEVSKNLSILTSNQIMD